MKTIRTNKPSFLVFTLILSLFLSTSSYAQKLEVKGIIKGKTNDKTEVLENATVYLKGTKTATTSNKKGEFTFPKKLNAGDVLVFSYLGYLKKYVKIKEENTILNVILKEDDNQMLGALNTNKRYASKRKKQ